MTSPWIAYNDLAWTEMWLADPAEYEDEAMAYVDLIKRAAAKPPRTLLHLGSGAGGHDRIFKRHFSVTGVDFSPIRLAIDTAAAHLKSGGVLLVTAFTTSTCSAAAVIR